ncbi:uncharacterized protein A4U43_C07F22650 [Asparagus officinalis]|uniref:At3g05675-like ankyrin-like domain-containing protein n=1 Tax=Asparagus officinalis TaxID=4686 RepID=A0A5P1EEE6_ASPOF|nr:uncharacterized protein A4U43_C07F22650 [Asparagus officinalis]
MRSLRRSVYRLLVRHTGRLASSAPPPSGPTSRGATTLFRFALMGLFRDINNRSSSRLLSFSGPGLGLEEELESEKLAHEVLWIVNKMMMCEIVEEAIVSWGLEDRLAALSLTANARVQGPIVKISAILLQELARGEWEAPREVKFRILLLWLPVLCYASNGVTRPVLMGLERLEIEVAIEGLILSLPLEDQEAILGNWLKDFAVIDSDWPNLQRCFDCWCRNSRKLLL